MERSFVTASELISELQKAPPDATVYVARNAETDDEWYEGVDRISLIPSVVLICNEDEQIVGKR